MFSFQEFMDQSEHSNPLEGAIPPPLDLVEFIDALGNFESIDRIDNHLDISIDLNAIDESNEFDIPLDMEDDMHFDGDFDSDCGSNFDKH